MPRTAGAKNILTRMKLDSSGTVYYIPTEFVQVIKDRDEANLPRILLSWAKRMIAKGITAEYIQENRNDIGDDQRAKDALEMAITNWDKNPDPKVEAEEQAKAAAAAAAAERIANERMAAEKTKFPTNKTHFQGIARNNPPASDCRPLPFAYIDFGGKDLKFIDRIAAKGKRPLLYIGPAGSGKTARFQYQAHELGLGCTIVGHHAHTEVEDLLGRFVPGQQGPVWQDGPLTHRVRHGGFFVADEMPASKAQVNMVYNQLLNGDGLPLVSDKGFELLMPHSNFRFGATANPWQEYAGMNELNLAQISRFYVHRFDYPTAAQELKILSTNYQSIDPEELQLLIKFANETRDAKRKDETKMYVVSTRSLVMTCELIEDYGASLKEAVTEKILEESYIVDPTEGKALGALIAATFR